MITKVNINYNDDDAPNVGAYTLSGTNDFGESIDVAFKVVIDGVEVIPETTVVTGITDTSNWSGAVNMVTDSTTGKYLTGSTVIYVIVYSTGTSSQLASDSALFTFNPYDSSKRLQEITTENSTDKSTGLITFKETSSVPYEGSTPAANVSRSWSVTIPPVLGYPSNTITGAQSSISLSIQFLNVTYYVSYKLNIDYDIITSGNIIVSEFHKLTTEYEYYVKLYELGGLCECALERIKDISDRITCSGTYPSNDDDSILVNSVVGFLLASDCEDNDKAGEFYNKIKEVIECDCCDEDDSPQLYSPNGAVVTNATGWEELTLTGGFASVSPSMRWRINDSGNLEICGKFQIPGGLTVGSPVLFATGWTSISNYYSTVRNVAIPCYDTGGVNNGTLFIDSSNGDITFYPNTNYSGGAEFSYVNGYFTYD